MDPNHLTPLPVRKQLHMSTHERLSYIDTQDSPVATPQPMTEIIDLSLDSDEETLALVSPSRVKTPLSSGEQCGLPVCHIQLMLMARRYCRQE